MCKYCNGTDNDFVLLNETSDYSGIEMALNKQGMLRTRYYDDSSHIWFSEDIINVKFCPMCGRKLTENNIALKLKEIAENHFDTEDTDECYDAPAIGGYYE